MTLGQRIRERRKILGITQQDLATITKTTLQHVSAIEQSKRTPSLPLMIKLSENLHSSLDYLVFGKEVVIDLIAGINADESLDTEAKKSLINLLRVLRANNHKQGKS